MKQGLKAWATLKAIRTSSHLTQGTHLIIFKEVLSDIKEVGLHFLLYLHHNTFQVPFLCPVHASPYAL